MTAHAFLTMAGYGSFGLILAELYLLPILVGWARQVPGLGSLALIDIALGWTVIGWALALAMALRPAAAARTVTGRTPPEAGSREPSAAPPLVLPPPSAGGHASS
jgi:hypothetical protein